MVFLRKLLSLLLILFAITYAGFFAFLNSAPIYVNLPYFGEYKAPGAVSFILAFVMGALFAMLYFGLDSMKKSFELRRRGRELSALKRDQHGDDTEFSSRRGKSNKSKMLPKNSKDEATTKSTTPESSLSPQTLES
jgi:uncharacterized integral membrane protein